MPRMSTKVSEILEQAMELSSKERGILIDRLTETLDDGEPEEGLEDAWFEEIKRRVDEIRSGKVKMIPGDEVDKWLSKRLRNATK